jgi:cell division protein FtsA
MTIEINQPYLFLDIDDKKIIFSVVQYNEKLEHKIKKISIIDSKGIHNGKVTDIYASSEAIKQAINKIEDEIDYTFSKVIIIVNPDNVNCLNVSGYKKLSGSQVSKEDVSYILNEIKQLIALNYDRDSLIHLFNSSFSIDSDNLENLPIGLFGEFYNQNMTFFLVDKNILRNIKLIINNSAINIERVILKPFAESVNLLSNGFNKNFTSIRLGANRITLSVFKNKSYIYSEQFNFGTNFLIKDMSKLCSLEISEAEIILKELDLSQIIIDDKETNLDRKYFINSPFRKIKHKLVYDIITARLEEFFEVIYEKNINLSHFRKNNKTLYVSIENHDLFSNIKSILQKKLSNKINFFLNEPFEDSLTQASLGAAVLYAKGWEKEAIPVIQPKKSIISRLFSSLFN